MSKKVLIVDDAAFMRMMIKDILTKNGFEVVGEAQDGAQAVEKYKELKQAMIDQYSMFGMNMDVSLRDTDYSWFPYMPAHWKLVRANRLFKENVRPVQDGDVSLSLSQVDGLIPTDDMSDG